MMSQRPRRNHSPTFKAKSTGTDSRKEAEVLLAKWKLEAHQEKSWSREPVRTFDELMLYYLDGSLTRKRDRERDRYSAKQLYPVFSGRELNALGAAEVSAYIKHRLQAGIEPGTINREIGLLSTATTFIRMTCAIPARRGWFRPAYRSRRSAVCFDIPIFG
jgi:hypothetical protein